jgi:hypothetical protein
VGFSPVLSLDHTPFERRSLWLTAKTTIPIIQLNLYTQSLTTTIGSLPHYINQTSTNMATIPSNIQLPFRTMNMKTSPPPMMENPQNLSGVTIPDPKFISIRMR